MKKIILCLTLALMSATTMFAVKAKPGITQLQLVDGTIVSATLHGDEHFSYYSLLDGTPLKKCDNGKYEIISTETLNARKATVINTLKTRASGIGSTYPSYFPHTGSPKALVILVQFQDVNSRAATPLPPSTITSMPISAQQYLVRMFRYSTRKMSTTVR